MLRRYYLGPTNCSVSDRDWPGRETPKVEGPSTQVFGTRLSWSHRSFHQFFSSSLRCFLLARTDMNRPEPTMHFKLDLSARLIFSVETHSSWQGARCQHSLQIWIFRHAGRIHSSGLQDFSARSWFGQYLPDVLHIGTGRFSWDPVCFGTVADAKAAKTLRRRRRKDAVHAADATTLRR